MYPRPRERVLIIPPAVWAAVTGSSPCPRLDRCCTRTRSSADQGACLQGDEAQDHDERGHGRKDQRRERVTAAEVVLVEGGSRAGVEKPCLHGLGELVTAAKIGEEQRDEEGAEALLVGQKRVGAD